MKKKILALCLVVALAATAVIGGTLAYFTDDEEATNTFTVGNVDIELEEENWENDPQVYPGEILGKDPTVENVGANPCFVRIKVEGLDCLYPAGLITYRTDSQTGALGDNWVDGGDGYFYYDQVLEVDATTDALFDQIVIPTDLENGDAETAFNVVVTAEAVQSEGSDADSVDDIIAWFNTCIPAPVEPDAEEG